MLTRRRILLALAVLAGLLLVIQAVPYGRDHADPAPTRSLRYDTARTAQLVKGACADCHSFDTTWPWYSNVAPVSWLVAKDVTDGRERLNFSRWDQPQPDLQEVLDVVEGGEMPPLQYKLIHAGARLSDAESRQLVAGLRRSWLADPPAGTTSAAGRGG